MLMATKFAVFTQSGQGMYICTLVTKKNCKTYQVLTFVGSRQAKFWIPSYFMLDGKGSMLHNQTASSVHLTQGVNVMHQLLLTGMIWECLPDAMIQGVDLLLSQCRSCLSASWKQSFIASASSTGQRRPSGSCSAALCITCRCPLQLMGHVTQAWLCASTAL